MSRGIKVLAAVAVLLLLAGAFERSRAVSGLAFTLKIVGSLRVPTPHDLGEGILEARAAERTSDVLVALGSALLALAAVYSVPSRSLAASSAGALVLLVAGLAAGAFPGTQVGGALLLDQSNIGLIYPECGAPDDGALHVFVLQEPHRSEWYCSWEERGDEKKLDPHGLEGELGLRLARDRRNVAIFLVDSCQGEWRDAFVATARRACASTKRTCTVARLPSWDELCAGWHKEAYAASGPYATLALVGTMARLVSAIACALLVVLLVRGGASLPWKAAFVSLALASLLATPWPLWDAVQPDAVAGSPTFKRASETADLYLTLARLSAAALLVAAVAGVLGARREPGIETPAP